MTSKLRFPSKSRANVLTEVFGFLAVFDNFFNDFLSKTSIQDSTTPLPAIQTLTGAVLETITFTLLDVTIAIRRFRQSFSPRSDGLPFTCRLHYKSGDPIFLHLRNLLFTITDNEPEKDSLDVNTLSFKLLPCTPSNPRFWLRQIEAVFSTSRITSERTRYSYVVQSLPFDVAVDVDDLLDAIPANYPYTQLKNAVIQRVAKSTNRMLRELFTQVERDTCVDWLACRRSSRRAITPSGSSRQPNSPHRVLTTGKRPRQSVTATAAAGQSRPGRLFYISDKTSGLRFLVDTGAEICVIPPPRRHHLKLAQFSLQAANSTTINTYGQRSLTLDIGLRRRFQWVFVHADVKSPIIEADFLIDFDLAVDLKHRKLIDTTTTLFTVGIAASEPSVSIQSTVPNFLGHHVDHHGITPLLEKVQSILSFPVPKTLTYLRRFIGLLNYYRRFIPHCAATLATFTDLLKSKTKPIEVPPAAHSAFEAANSDPHTQLILTTDSSNCAVGALLHQQVNNQLQPLAFFSQKLQPAQTRYSAFSRELLVIYLAIRHFRHLLEGRNFAVHTDHKPFLYTLKAKPDRYSPREVRHLDFISQFTADIHYVRGSDNVIADALARPDINTLASDFDLAKLADLQSGDKSIDELRSTTTLQLRDAPLPASPGTILCDWSTATPRPVVPLSYRKTVFAHFHSLSHPGIRASRIRASVKKDIQCTAAELVYGTPLRLPGEFVQSSTTNTNNPSTFVQHLKQRMAQLRPTPTRLTSKLVFVHEDLKSSPFVFVRHDAVRKSLCSPYDDPYKVLQRMNKYYVIQKADKTDTVSIDRLKPAYLECVPPSVMPPSSSAPSSHDSLASVPSTEPPHSTTPPTHSDFPFIQPRTSSRSALSPDNDGKPPEKYVGTVRPPL
nr:unnamed protein product [Spirometra erinaceieuropaei]